ncbi:LysR family transcriptional regulator [Nocardioides donggukensis]|uniref:LysR family transcriptional regulator n=1 Tax=Nocardioides donggukensis TaxID=2774019 RepID=A0A927K5N0_9ACTN|nr:LysR family transcriptional regulator [Nocardioides donggukensis]MBD8870366.1 LysR family transcriptional regulator [Nocardioides donggukensis]
MDTRRLHLLVELSRLGSMREVADAEGLTTSTVSQQLAALAKESGSTLLEPDGRRVRLTPAGRRLADHAVRILAAVEAARRDLDPSAEPSGTVRVAGFATAIRRALLPAIHDLRGTHPALRVELEEYEPLEAVRALADDRVDLALVYDYNLAPSSPGAPGDAHESVPLWTAPWGLGVPAGDHTDVADLDRFAEHVWIVNSRNTADEDAVRTLASLAGFTPAITHRIDNLDLVQELIADGHGVGLLPLGRTYRPGVQVLPLPEPGVLLRAYALTRPGRSTWPPLRAVLDRVVDR